MIVYRCECGMPIVLNGMVPAGTPTHNLGKAHPNLITGRECGGRITGDQPETHRDNPFCRCYMCRVRAENARQTIPHNPNRGIFCECQTCTITRNNIQHDPKKGPFCPCPTCVAEIQARKNQGRF